LTYRAAGSNAIVENGWSRIKTLEEAEAVAKAAREGKADPRASEFGRRGGKARWARDSRYGNRTEGDDEKKISSHGNRTDVGTETVLKGGVKNWKTPVFLGTETVPLYRLSRGRVPASTRGDTADARLTRTPPVALMRFVDAAYLIAGRRYETPLPCEQSERVPKRSAAPTAHSDLQHQTEIA
jgi:hypothetical protein